MEYTREIHTLATEIVIAYISNNAISQEALPFLIRDVHRALSLAGSNERLTLMTRTAAAEAIPKTVFPDYVVCLEDGHKFQSLKRHLAAYHDLTPDQYREKWKLPPDYPMVSPNYTKRRSLLAQRSGLGTKGRLK